MKTAKTDERLRPSHRRHLTVTAAAARVFPGRAEQAGEARRWVRVLAAGAGVLAAGDAELAVGELFANAVVHTRSGADGGKVAVVVVPDDGGAAVHVHDQGAAGRAAGLVPSGGGGGLPVSGRGLLIVAAVCAGWGTGPAAGCPHAGADDPAVAAGGCCTWCRLPAAVALRAVPEAGTCPPSASCGERGGS